MSDLPVLSAAHQLGTVRLARELVPVPEWGHAVWVWELTGEDLDAYRNAMYRTKGAKVTLDLRSNTARLLTYAVRDEHGNRVFDDATGVSRLLGMGSAGVERLAKVARRLSALDDDDDDDEGDDAGEPVLVGNSEPAPTGNSTSDWPGTSG